ncbi:MAG: hypothetical protein IPO22_04150 [Anaerolineales bacterium]|nr:hypothetical protein [Anaerolineales bacterium]
MKISSLDRTLLLLTGLLAGYQIAIGIDQMDSVSITAYTIAFGVILVAGLLLIILGFEVLDSPVVVITSTIIPLTLSLGLVWQHLASLRTVYLVFTIISFLAVILTRAIPIQNKLPVITIAITRHCRDDHLPAPHHPRLSRADEAALRPRGRRRRIDRRSWLIALLPENRQADIIEGYDHEIVPDPTAADDSALCRRFQIRITHQP